MIEVNFDGLCIPNTPDGIACYAYLVRRNGVLLHSDYGVVPKSYSKETSNNVAEYVALIRSLEWLVANGYSSGPDAGSPLFQSHSIKPAEPVIIRGDSDLIISQMNGAFKVRKRHLKPLHEKAISLAHQFKSLKIEWVPRTQNAEADRLSEMAYADARMKLSK